MQYDAYLKARRSKRRSPAAADFERRQEDELLRLSAELLSRTWQPGPYHSFYIHDPKRRLISAVPFRDRSGHIVYSTCEISSPRAAARCARQSASLCGIARTSCSGRRASVSAPSGQAGAHTPQPAQRCSSMCSPVSS